MPIDYKFLNEYGRKRVKSEQWEKDRQLNNWTLEQMKRERLYYLCVGWFACGVLVGSLISASIAYYLF